MKCPNCNEAVPQENINISADIAQCSACRDIFKISENIDRQYESFDLDFPPKGAWIIKDIGQTIVGATTKSAFAFFLVPFMLVWTGGSLGGIYGTQIWEGEFDLFLSLFGIPFILGAILFWSLTLMSIWGKVEITLNDNGGKIFTGMGRIGINKEFLWDEVTGIKEIANSIDSRGSKLGKIIIEGKKRIIFGSGLSQNRAYYIVRSLQKIYGQKRTKRSINFV